MFPSSRKSSVSSTSSSKSIAATLLQFSPLQSPHAGTQNKPFFLHEQIFVPHVFFDVSLHLQRMKFSKFCGPASLSVVIGTRAPFSTFHPQSVGTRTDKHSVFHCATCRWTLKLWKYAARSVGGNDCGSMVFVAPADISKNRTCRSLPRVSDSLPL